MDVVTKILVVDNESQLRDSLRRHLRRDGYQVESASDTIQARRQIAREGHSIDLVITGAFAPLLEGSELIHWVHRHHPDISTILMSDFGPDLGGTTLHQGHVDELCGSPTSPAEIRKLIARIDFRRLAARMYGRRIETL